MNVRKLRGKSVFSNPKTIRWLVHKKYKYLPIKIDTLTWKIFSQEEITLKPREVKIVGSGLGFSSTKGVNLTSLDNKFIFKGCSLQSEVTEIFSQEEITLKPREVKIVGSGLGFSSTKGVNLTSLDNKFIFKGCSLQSEVTFGDVQNILIFITNNSTVPVNIKERELLCYVHYHV